MKKAAFAFWDNRIAPVFDVARQIFLVEAEAGRIVGESQATLAGDLPVQKALDLVELGVNTLVCGAISKPLHAIISGYGIRLIPFIAGDLREVINAWLSDKVEQVAFAMPGCCGRGHHSRRGLHNIKQEKFIMNGNSGRGTGGGRGRGRGGQGQGRMGGPVAGGALGNCLCPKCGHRERHERGTPCVQKQCPKCGTALIREE